MDCWICIGLLVALACSGGVEAGCPGDVSVWCVFANTEAGLNTLFVDASKNISQCKQSCETDETCLSFDYEPAQKTCYFYATVQDDFIGKENQDRDYYVLNCDQSSCAMDTTPQVTTTPAITTTSSITTNTETATTDMITSETTSLKMGADTVMTDTNTAHQQTTTSMVTKEDAKSLPTEGSNTDSLWQIRPVWAAMIGMGALALLLVLIILVLLCTLKSRQHKPN